MKKTILLMMSFFLLVSLGFAQEKKYEMYEMQYMKPKNDKLKELNAAMANHNKKYHSTGPYSAHVWLAETGPHTGEWCWVMGPCTFTELDSRPDSKEHTEDWMYNVMPYVESVSDGEYWKLDDKLNYSPEGSFSGKEVWTVYNLKPYEGYRFTVLCEKVMEVYKKKNYPEYFRVYRTQFSSDSGRDIAIGFGFKNWAYFDQEDTFWKDYEEIHGEGSKWKFTEEYREIVESSFEEVSTLIPELSGPEKK
jgi:hypothetical protein